MKSLSQLLLAAALGYIPACAAVTISTNGLSNVTIGKSTGGGSICASGYVTIPISVTGTKLDYVPPTSAAGVTQSLVELFQVTDSLANTITGTQLISGSYQIYVKLCIPSSASKAASVKTVQLLTHGATLDHNYWDIVTGYSYIDAATEAGYATLSYDQLGVGNSAHPDPIQVVQANSQVAVTHALAQLLRNAKIGNYSFENVVGVGHSAGSSLTQAVTTQYPSDFDAAILTGTSTNDNYVSLSMAAFNLINANSDSSGRFSSLAAGYLTQQTSVGIQFAFYSYPNFNTAAFNSQVANKQTNTLGVLLTLGGIVASAPEFTGPVDVILGENDFVFCGGNCSYPENQAALVLSTFYPSASSGSQTYLASGSGHAIAAHDSASASFTQMIDFLQSNDIY
ncbi:Alpha/Beta hydrolase protein [Penicillium verhagenii]|uniref:Alpha/Beta hydrolase protein n=1 Tax=Penicillium verhagenii TaxID=1562060 RepID=UPI00254545EA|nr:Alpha/Beta hydrolase protein [Penicillium verhagenii]KAJ5915480.1 Alpha/Beta hydrolase protein [Penicillium verhagenii]